MPEVCPERPRITELERRIGKGDVMFATIDLKLDQIHEQTSKTNGRVNKLEADAIKHALTWKHVLRDLLAITISTAGIASAIIKVLGQ
jgi:hypothetical protein